MVNLPPFLQPLTPPAQSSSYLNAHFVHSSPLGSSHALWWPPLINDRKPESILLFIPGNPGTVDFYISFLSYIHQQHLDSNLAILAHSHLDHYSGINNTSDKRYSKDECLSVQVQTSLEVLDAIIRTYSPDIRIILIGHSVGSWIVLQMLKFRSTGFISAAFFLFPTLSNIAKTPNGVLLAVSSYISLIIKTHSVHSWLTYIKPIFLSLSRRILSTLSVLLRYLPGSLFALIYSSWPPHQLRVLQHFLSSRTSVLAALDMGAEEMRTIHQLDIPVLEQTKDKLYFYYAHHDDWVGEEKKPLIRSLDLEGSSNKVTEGPIGIPHAFCINHSEPVAQQCLLWLKNIIVGS